MTSLPKVFKLGKPKASKMSFQVTRFQVIYVKESEYCKCYLLDQGHQFICLNTVQCYHSHNILYCIYQYNILTIYSIPIGSLYSQFERCYRSWHNAQTMLYWINYYKFKEKLQYSVPGLVWYVNETQSSRNAFMQRMRKRSRVRVWTAFEKPYIGQVCITLEIITQQMENNLHTIQNLLFISL